MLDIDMYETARGECYIKEYILDLRKNANTRSDSQKIGELIERFRMLGTQIPNKERIEGDIWQLKVNRHRLFYFNYGNNIFVLLHAYRKETPKTPKTEIERANKEMKDYINRKKLTNKKLN